MKETATQRTGKEKTLPSRLIDARIKDLGGWRGETLARIPGSLFREADPEIIEEWKWGIPVWSARRNYLHRRDLPRLL
jgi:hypothetical protein